MKKSFLASALLALPALAQAQVTPVGPFVGDESDNFTAQTAGMFSMCLVGRLFNNHADMCNVPGTGSGMHVTGGWGFMCSIGPHSGGRLFGSAGGPAQILLDQDAQQFGGYFGTNSWAAGNPLGHTVTVEFHDRNGNLIDSVLANVTPDCQWNWNGWSSPTPFATVTIINSAFGGAFVDLDDLEVTWGPGSVGTTYCQSNANSTGNVAQLYGTGSASVAANNLTLNSEDMPNNATAFFITSLTQGMTQNPGGSQGILCLGGSIGRYVGPGQIQNSGATGEASLLLDLTNIPQPNGGVPAAPGTTWNFQCWFRDSLGGNATSNFSTGLSVMMQ